MFKEIVTGIDPYKMCLIAMCIIGGIGVIMALYKGSKNNNEK